MVCEKEAVPKNRCHIRYLQLFSTVKYKVTLTVTNALGRNSTTITFDEFAIGNFHGRHLLCLLGAWQGGGARERCQRGSWGVEASGCPWAEPVPHPHSLPKHFTLQKHSARQDATPCHLFPAPTPSASQPSCTQVAQLADKLK